MLLDQIKLNEYMVENLQEKIDHLKFKPLTQNYLSEKLGISQGSVSRSLAKLTTRQMVETKKIRTGVGKRKKKGYYLTDIGKETGIKLFENILTKNLQVRDPQHRKEIISFQVNEILDHYQLHLVDILNEVNSSNVLNIKLKWIIDIDTSTEDCDRRTKLDAIEQIEDLLEHDPDSAYNMIKQSDYQDEEKFLYYQCRIASWRFAFKDVVDIAQMILTQDTLSSVTKFKTQLEVLYTQIFKDKIEDAKMTKKKVYQTYKSIDTNVQSSITKDLIKLEILDQLLNEKKSIEVLYEMDYTILHPVILRYFDLLLKAGLTLEYEYRYEKLKNKVEDKDINNINDRIALNIIQVWLLVDQRKLKRALSVLDKLSTSYDLEHNFATFEILGLKTKIFLEINANKKFKEAITQLQTIVDVENDRHHLLSDYYRNYVIQSKGKFEAIQSNYSKAIEIYTRGLNNLTSFERYYWRNYFFQMLAICHINTGKFDEASKYFEKIEKGENHHHLFKLNTSTIINQASLFLAQGELDQALEYYTKSYELGKSLDNKYFQATSLEGMGASQRRKGHFQESLDTYEKCEELYEELEETFSQIHIYNKIGNLHTNLGNLELSKQYHNKSLSLAKQANYDRLIAMNFNNLGNIYQIKGHLDIALNKYKSVLQLTIDKDDKHLNFSTILNIGSIHRIRKNYSKAETYFEKYLSKSREIGIIPKEAKGLKNLVILHTDMDNKQKSLKYLEQLEDIIHKNSNQEKLFQIFQIAQAYVFKNSDTISDKAKALRLFNTLKNSKIPFKDKIFVINNLLDILFMELQYSGERDVYLKIKDLLGDLLSSAKEYNMISVMIKTHIIKSKLVFIEQDIDKALSLLNQAEIIAHENHIFKYLDVISKEFDFILENKTIVEDPSWGNMELKDKMKTLNLNQIVQTYLKDELEEEPQDYAEPSLFVVTNTDGNPIYSKNYTDDIRINKDYLSGLISTLYSFGVEILTDKERPIQKVYYSDIKFLIHEVEQLLFCFGYHGSSISARETFLSLCDSLRELINQLPSHSQSNMSEIDKHKLNELVISTIQP